MEDLGSCSKVQVTNDALVVVSWKIYLDQGGEFDKDKNCVYSSEVESLKTSLIIDLKDCLNSGDHFDVSADIKAGYDPQKVGPYEYDSNSEQMLCVELCGKELKTRIIKL